MSAFVPRLISLPADHALASAETWHLTPGLAVRSLTQSSRCPFFSRSASGDAPSRKIRRGALQVLPASRETTCEIHGTEWLPRMNARKRRCVGGSTDVSLCARASVERTDQLLPRFFDWSRTDTSSSLSRI